MHTDITWTDSAWEQWKAKRADCADIAAYFGEQLGREHLHELQDRFIQTTFAAGPVNVQTDGDGFYITTPHIVIGLVWTPDSDAELLRRIDHDRVGGRWMDAVPDAWPRTGRWSAHS